jgi:broad specificity phosphatase PhoE
MVGEKIGGGGQAFYAHSDYDRTKQTCENIAIGRGDEFIHEEWGILNGDWYRKDIPALKRNGWDNWESLSQWAYEGGKEEGFYNLEERSREWLDSLKAHLPGMKRINVLVSHDYMVTPMAVYASDKQVDLHYWVNRKWINYLAGIAIIIDPQGNMRFKTVRGLDSGVLAR